MMWGRPLKTHPQGGGGYPTLEDFRALYGLNLLFRLLDAFCLSDDVMKTTIRPRYTYICFLSTLVYLSVCQCLFLYIMYARG